MEQYWPSKLEVNFELEVAVGGMQRNEVVHTKKN